MPFIACDLLSSDASTILYAFFGSDEDEEQDSTEDKDKTEGDEEKEEEKTPKADHQKENLDKFFGFVKQEGELNTVLCGYFNKVLTSFLSSRASELLEYVYTNDVYTNDVLQHMRKHLYSRSIVEAYVKLVAFGTDNLHSIF